MSLLKKHHRYLRKYRKKVSKMTTILNVKVHLILKSPHKWVFHTAGQTLPVSCHSLASLMLKTIRRDQNRCNKRRSVTWLWLSSVTSVKQVKKPFELPFLCTYVSPITYMENWIMKNAISPNTMLNYVNWICKNCISSHI